MHLTLIVLITLFLFYLLAVVCDEYFVPAIDKIAHNFKLSSDVSGATLLAAGSSAPEFAASIIAVFGLAGAEADVGAGTIVGSAIFNVLVIIGASAMFRAVVLQWKPIIRDLGFYVVTIVLLFLFFRDGSITLVEAIIFLAVYALYIFACLNWRRWFKYEDIKREIKETTKKKNKNFFSASFRKCLNYIVPDVEKKPSLVFVTFFMCMAIITVASYFLVEQLVTAADILGVNQTFLALTVLAAGTSLPDLIGSIIMAKQGRGDMAVGNAIGSNIFDILFGLGLPWFLYLLFNGGNIKVSNDNLDASIILLFATVVAILFLLIIRKWKIGRNSGLVLIFLYVGYVIYELSKL